MVKPTDWTIDLYRDFTKVYFNDLLLDNGKMYNIVKLAPLTLLQSLSTILDDAENRIRAVSYTELYKVQGYRTQDTEIMQAQDSG
jgi:hypothetical protein